MATARMDKVSAFDGTVTLTTGARRFYQKPTGLARSEMWLIWIRAKPIATHTSGCVQSRQRPLEPLLTYAEYQLDG